MPDPTQELRPLRIDTDLGPDVLLIERFRGTEALCRPFEYLIQTICEDELVKPRTLIGTNVTISMDLFNGEDRYFNGIVSQVAHTGFDRRGFSRYELVVVPTLWFLTRTSDCKIFQNKSVMEIIEEIFGDHGIKDHERRLSRVYKPREYCVQYRETDFDFVHRLMEHEGIYYFFEHEEGKHKLIFCDSMDKHKPVENFEEIRLRNEEGTVHGEFVIRNWQVRSRTVPGSYVINSYNFEAPLPSPVDRLVSRSKQDKKYNHGAEEVYDNPGDYLERADGEAIAKIRREQVQAEQVTVTAQTTSRALRNGCKFKLNEHPKDDQNAQHIIISMMFQIQGGGFASGNSSGQDLYEASFTAIPVEGCVFRPARVTTCPKVQGPQTAVVCGPAGEEIYTDKHARVKVQFLWDRYGKNDAGSSCWIRVSQPWAGKGWGSMATPRIGQEVIVDFLEGDPDRPIVTGRVYNADQAPPYAAGMGVISGLKSNTHKGKGYNEMSMDDTAGKEKITIHAQYDMHTTVEHDDTQIVHNDRHITVDGKHTETIKKDTSIKILEGKLEHRVETGTADYYVKAAVTEKYDATQATTVKDNIDIKSTAGEILIEAAKKITLHTGGSKITMSSDGTISITGKSITIVGDSDVKASAPTFEATGSKEAKLGTGNQNITTNVGKTAISGAAISSSAVGMHDITGALVKIN